MDCAGLDIVRRSDRKPAIAKTDEYFTKASFHKSDWRGRVKEAGKSPQKSEKECIGTGFINELQDKSNCRCDYQSNNACPKCYGWRQFPGQEHSAASRKLVLVQLIGQNISTVIKIFAGMVCGKHNQDNPQDAKKKNFNADGRIDPVCQNGS